MSTCCAATGGYESPTCTRDATMAVKATIRKAGDLTTTIYWDDTDAPKNASRYCANHGMELVVALGQQMTASDRQREDQADAQKALDDLNARRVSVGPGADS